MGLISLAFWGAQELAFVGFCGFLEVFFEGEIACILLGFVGFLGCFREKKRVGEGGRGREGFLDLVGREGLNGDFYGGIHRKRFRNLVGSLFWTVLVGYWVVYCSQNA